jgi:hypothetical protein
MAKRDAFRVVGVEDDAAKIEGEDPGFGKLWFGRFMPLSKEVEPYRTNGVSYGVFSNARGIDLTGGRYVAGVAVGVDALCLRAGLHEISQQWSSLFSTRPFVT